ncbi:Dead end protein-like protein 1 [Bos mutus]|uniref:Dead end protein-like protein 1 n=1 Tax=Bos mutus TaxID=72004 RepID=L8I9Q2_9CETA|nr:Dead end protein-like protein 1 [Bos mutus]
MQSKRECELWCERVNPENKAALEAWVRETGIRLVQVNGQRKYGGPPPGNPKLPVTRTPQPKQMKFIICAFPPTRPLEEGSKSSLKMPVPLVIQSLDYADDPEDYGCFTHFTNVCTRTPSRARSLDPDPGTIRTEKCELSVDGLPPGLSHRALLRALQPLGPGLQEALLLPSPGPTPAQIALLKFSSHRAAAMAKKALVEGQSHLCGEQVAVEWLKPDLKQRLRQQLMGTSLQCLQPEGSRLALARDQGLEFQGSQVALQLLCQRMKLGSPVFLTKCLGTSPAGWHRFWYQVVIPGHPVPFSGLIWVVLTPDGQDGHEVAKDAVSARLLEAMSESRASLLWSTGAEAGGTMVQQ